MRTVKAISVRQPWAWLIVHGFKTIENRSRKCGYVGEVFIHASKGMTYEEYEKCLWFCMKAAPGLQLPDPVYLWRGGIIGKAMMIGCVDQSSSPWFTGPYGRVLASAQETPVFECRGQQAVPFNVEVPDGYGA